MPHAQQQSHAVTLWRGQNILPIGLKFVGLAEPQGTESLRIRFSLDLDKLLDIPLSAKSLADLVHVLSPLHGIDQDLPDATNEKIAYLRGQGLIADE
jgi:hypothetical protein